MSQSVRLQECVALMLETFGGTFICYYVMVQSIFDTGGDRKVTHVVRTINIDAFLVTHKVWRLRTLVLYLVASEYHA